MTPAVTNLAAIRNIGIMAHIDAGKTTISERILYYTGVTYKIGEVHDGTTVLDWTSQERAHGITITAAAITCEWKGRTIVLLDTPGHVDFTIEVERSLRVLDGAVAVYDAVAGVEAQTENVWRQADRYHVPRLCFVNKLDRTGADFHRCVRMMVDRLGATPLILQLPIGTGADFIGVVDLLEMRALVWRGDTRPGEDYTVQEIPVELEREAMRCRQLLLEDLSTVDDEVLVRYLDGAELSVEEIRAGIRRATIASRVNPVLCGSAFRNKGVQPLLDAVLDYLPSPLDMPPVTGIAPDDGMTVSRVADVGGPVAALAFKVQTDKHLGRLTYLRIYSGRLAAGQTLLNSTKDSKERIGKVFQMRSNRREERPNGQAGDIVAVQGLRHTTTGDTLCDPVSPVVLESMTFPEPVLTVAIEPQHAVDAERLSTALQKLAAEDPSLRVLRDEESGQTVIGGMGELHLEVLVDRMAEEFDVRARIGAPQVAYRETIRTRVEQVTCQYRKQNGGKGQFAKVVVNVEPLPMDPDGPVYQFDNKVTGGRIPKEYIASVDAGAQDATQYGVLAGYPLVGVRLELVDGRHHEQDSSEMAFRIAGSMALKEAARMAEPVLLEPLMAVEVTTPEENLGEVIGDLSSRRGAIQAMEERDGTRVVRANVPLSEMFGYVNDLRSRTQGRAGHSMRFDSYAEVPAHVAERLIAATPPVR